MTEIVSPWSRLSTDFLSEGEWAIGQDADAPDRRMFRALLRSFLGSWKGSEKPELLEVGCGSGIDLAALIADGLAYEVDYRGYDLTPEFVEHLRREFPTMHFERQDVVAIDEHRSADIVWCRHVLEHVEDGYRALARLWEATRNVLLVSWFIRPTWSEAEVRCDVSQDGFVHQHYSARRMLEFLGDLGAHRYRFDIDHHSTRASVWMLTREKEPALCEEAHRFLVSPRFLRSAIPVPPASQRSQQDLLDVLAETKTELDDVFIYTPQGEDDNEEMIRLGRIVARADAALFSADPLRRYKRFVLWGFTDSLDSMRHIMRHYAKAARALGLDAVHLANAKDSPGELCRGDLVLAVDVESDRLIALPGVHYVLHNFSSEHPVWRRIEEHQFLRLQVYTSDAERYGVQWDPVRRFDAGARTLFQPWGTDLLTEEFMEPVFNPDSSAAAFVGAIWDDGGLGNATLIEELKILLGKRGLSLDWRTQIPDEEMVKTVRSARIAPAFAGHWQVEHGYLPCRAFKNVSYGQIALTNVPKFRDLFAGCSLRGETVAKMLDEALGLSEKDWREYVRAQQQVVARYTYRESLQAIGRALEEGKR